MAALFTKEAKDAIGPLALRILIIVVSLAGAMAIYHMSGGDPIPFFSDVTPIILGLVAFMVIEKNLSK
jgi:uncharacterized membrane protein YbhN (UPF0104 family)